MGGRLECRVTKERADRGEPQVAAARRDSTSGLEVIQEGGDQRRVDLLEGQLC